MDDPVILIIDDEKNILSSLSRALSLEGYQPVTADNGTAGLSAVSSHRPDLVMLDVRMPDISGLEVLKSLKEDPKTRDIPVVVMSGHGTLDTAISAIKLGAHDFIEKPLSVDKILITLNNALRFSQISRENKTLKAQEEGRYQLLGDSPVMQQLVQKIRLTAPTNGRVLITGENGTGKELVARAIHRFSKRAAKPFVKLNCAAIPSELIESELFGHEKGAFTGAHRTKKGKFEVADGGTLFLDEIGDLKLEVQAKLLRVLQEGELERVGGNQEIHVDVRIVAATNKDLLHEIEEGRFREDLYYRLNVVPFEVPPLRDHPEDIPTLARHFIELACQENDKSIKRLESTALEILRQQRYPGNIRELKNTCERLVILTVGESISAESLKSLVSGGASKRSAKTIGYQPGMSLKDMVEQAERDIVLAALRDHDGHVTNTAKALQIERSHLYKKAKSLDIDLKSVG